MSFQSPISVAPMIDWTDQHCRYFHRVISKSAVLYTEMIVDKAIIHGERARLLAGAREGVILQIGGSEPDELAAATRIAHELGYDHINLNCGCPSDRVQSGTFGAVLMKTPEKVERALAAMVAASEARISVKCRLGVDDQNLEESLPEFLRAVENAGVVDVIIHARKAWLSGLSPKENREIPPLDYELAAEMIARFPNLRFALNGGIASLEEAQAALDRGFLQAMIGRAAYQRPYDILARVDQQFASGDQQGRTDIRSREAIVEEMADYAAAHLASGGRLHQITRHMLGLYAGEPGGRLWRRKLSEGASDPNASAQLLFDAIPDAAAFASSA